MQGLFGMLTKKLKGFREPIHHLLTPYGGTRVLSVKDLDNDHDYVACHKNKLVTLDYENIRRKEGPKNSGRNMHSVGLR